MELADEPELEGLAAEQTARLDEFGVAVGMQGEERLLVMNRPPQVLGARLVRAFILARLLLQVLLRNAHTQIIIQIATTINTINTWTIDIKGITTSNE